jgi:2,3-dimethylmalate lyase
MSERAPVLRAALQRRSALVVPGCHDALSAMIVESAGFQAVQVSGFGVAGSLLGKPDVGLVDMKDVLDITGHIARAVSIPVMADIDTGGGNAINAAAITERLVEMGIAGVNIEDQVFPKRCGHMEGKQVIPAEEMVGKIRAMVDVRRKTGKDIVINARTDSFAPCGLREALFRCNSYLAAGADMVFIDGIATRGDIEHAARDSWTALRQPDGCGHRSEDGTHFRPRTGRHGDRARERAGGFHHGHASRAEGILCRSA